MIKSRIPLFLWILLAAILLLIIPVAVIDQIAHSSKQAAPAAPAGSAKTAQPGAPVGYNIGNAAPDFELTTTDKVNIKLSDYRGKKVILNFWATWCGPCRYETPFLQSISGLLAQKGIVLLAISTQDTLENALAYAQQYNLDFIIPVDPRGIVSRYYNIRGIPTTFFIDEQGIITSIKIGPFISEDEIAERLPSAFK